MYLSDLHQLRPPLRQGEPCVFRLIAGVERRPAVAARHPVRDLKDRFPPDKLLAAISIVYSQKYTPKTQFS